MIMRNNEPYRIIDAQKTSERGDKYYQAVVAWGIFGNYRILRRKHKTKSGALDYGLRFIIAWVLLHPENQTKAKKLARFS